MTTKTTSPDPSGRPRPGVPAALAVAVVAGAALGIVDLAWNVLSPSAWSAAANSCAVWAAAAYALGALLRVGAGAAAVAGIVMLGVAVEVYYLAGAAWLGWDRGLLTGASTVTWLQLAVVVGGALGAAGACSARGSWLPATLGTAACASIVVGEALHVWAVRPPAAFPGTAHVLALLGLAVLVAALRRPAVALAAAGVALPASVLAATAFGAAGVAI